MKLIKVTAIWCPSCLVMNSKINKIISEYDLEVLSYDYDLDKEIVSFYNIGKVLPEFILIDDNNSEIDRLVGECSLDKFREFLKR